MAPLHWAAVKGSKACIRHLVEAGADLEVKEEQGKTPRDMAEELKGLVPFERGLHEAGCTPDGRKQYGKLSEVSSKPRVQLTVKRNTTMAILALPMVMLLVIFKTFAYFPAYTSWPLAAAEFWLMQIVSTSVSCR
jgi:palmitoyltransferase